MKKLILAIALIATQASAWEGVVPAEFDLPAAKGDYVEGSVVADDAGVVLDLLADGIAVRRLSADNSGRASFRFVAPEDGQLRLGGPKGAAFTLTLDRVVTQAEQVPPPTEYLSPRMAALADGGDLEAFWQQVTRDGTPMVEKDILTFLYRGAKRNVRIFGAPYPDHVWMERFGQTDLWFKSFRVPLTTRLSYQLAPDVPDLPGTARERRMALGAVAAADPWNPNRWPADAVDAFAADSTVALQDAPVQLGLPAGDPPVKDIRFASALLGNERRVSIFRSADYDPADPEAVLAFIFDGPKAISDMQIPGILQNLGGQLPPIAAVFIDPIDNEHRGRELPGNPVFAKAMATELLPLVASELGLTPNPARAVVAGSSYGGIGASHVALSYPAVFGNVISMSGSYWWSPDRAASALPWMAQRVLDMPVVPVRFFISAGTFEHSRDGSADIRETSRLLHGVLAAKGYDTTWREYAGGHDAYVWRGTLADGLIALFGN